MEELPNLTLSYNNAVHRSIGNIENNALGIGTMVNDHMSLIVGISPNLGERPENHFFIRMQHAKKYAKFSEMKKPQLKINDLCVISFDRTKFSRSYQKNFGDTVYKISGYHPTMPDCMYSLVRADNDEPLKGWFYFSEVRNEVNGRKPMAMMTNMLQLQRIKDSDMHPIEKILKIDRAKGTAKVRWMDSSEGVVKLTDIKSYQELLSDELKEGDDLPEEEEGER